MQSSFDNVRAKRRFVFPLLAVMASCAVSYDLFADSLRCGRKVVRTGDPSSLLVKKCGHPVFKDRAVQQVRLDEGRKKVRVERWHYQKSSRSLSRAVLIYRGNIVGIETSGH